MEMLSRVDLCRGRGDQRQQGGARLAHLDRAAAALGSRPEEAEVGGADGRKYRVPPVTLRLADVVSLAIPRVALGRLAGSPSDRLGRLPRTPCVLLNLGEGR